MRLPSILTRFLKSAITFEKRRQHRGYEFSDGFLAIIGVGIEGRIVGKGLMKIRSDRNGQLDRCPVG